MSLGWAANLFQRGKAGQLRIRQLFAQKDASVPADEPKMAQNEPISFEAHEIEIRFPSGRGLGPISISIPPGGSLAIVGGIGSGKTMLLQVLAGLRVPQRGALAINGRQLSEDNLRNFWASLGWVPQEATLFSGTLEDNLKLGNPRATEEAMQEAANAACLDKFIQHLPEGFGTVVGERGLILSGGERQRSALARALMRKPSALLLDDCLSAVDAETESGILHNLEGYLGKSTLVLATHRIFVAELCERVIVLENGNIIQSGTPKELSQSPGPYMRMRALQSMESVNLARGEWRL
jgi:ATP-binding cassette subfamily B protein